MFRTWFCVNYVNIKFWLNFRQRKHLNSTSSECIFSANSTNERADILTYDSTSPLPSRIRKSPVITPPNPRPPRKPPGPHTAAQLSKSRRQLSERRGVTARHTFLFFYPIFFRQEGRPYLIPELYPGIIPSGKMIGVMRGCVTKGRGSSRRISPVGRLVSKELEVQLKSLCFGYRAMPSSWNVCFCHKRLKRYGILKKKMEWK